MNQHLISEVYLKQFGYQDKNDQWRVCILDISQFPIMFQTNKRWLSHKSIGSFLSKENHFDFENYDNVEFVRVFENASSEVETYIPMLIEELHGSDGISLKGEAILAHYISNLYVRTSNFDQLLDDLIELDAHSKFLQEVLIFNDSDEKKFFIEMVEDSKFNSKKNIRNLSRFLFWNYFWQRLAHFEYYILKPYPGQWWLSSDNPVILNNHVTEDLILSFETEIIFPFSDSILLLLKMEQSKSPSEIFEKTVLKKMTIASKAVNDKINKVIHDNADSYLIFANMRGITTF